MGFCPLSASLTLEKALTYPYPFLTSCTRILPNFQITSEAYYEFCMPKQTKWRLTSNTTNQLPKNRNKHECGFSVKIFVNSIKNLCQLCQMPESEWEVAIALKPLCKMTHLQFPNNGEVIYERASNFKMYLILGVFEQSDFSSSGTLKYRHLKSQRGDYSL